MAIYRQNVLEIAILGSEPIVNQVYTKSPT